MEKAKFNARLLLVAALIGAVTAVNADVTITANVTVTGKNRTETEKITTSYKGSLIRTESEKTVSIYDTDAQTVTTMRKADKSYRILALNDAMTRLPGMLSKIKVSSTAKVQPLAEKSLIAGKPAKKYIGTATISITPAGAESGNYPTTNIEIEQWMTEALKGNDAGPISPLEQFLGPLKMYGGLEPVIEAFALMKGMPLSSRVTVRITGGGQDRGAIVTTTEVKSIRESKLPNSLFVVPEGYTLQTIRNPRLPTRKNSPLAP